MTVIDTSSLLNFVRYYLPFDKDSTLFNFIKTNVESGEFVVIDKVYKQCGYTANGIVLEKLPFLKEHQTKTSDLLPEKHFFHLLENDFKNQAECKKITPEQFQGFKNAFIDDADFKMLLFCHKHISSIVPPRILTEETGRNNDCKLFKKLPTLCDIIGVGAIDLPVFFAEYDLIRVKTGTSS